MSWNLPLHRVLESQLYWNFVANLFHTQMKPMDSCTECIKHQGLLKSNENLTSYISITPYAMVKLYSFLDLQPEVAQVSRSFKFTCTLQKWQKMAFSVAHIEYVEDLTNSMRTGHALSETLYWVGNWHSTWKVQSQVCTLRYTLESLLKL